MGKMSVRRKLAIATWSAPKEGNIYGKVTFDVTKVQEYLKELRDKTGEKTTVTHFVGRVLAEALKRTPSMNGRIAWGRYIPHKTIDVTYLVVLDGGKNLAKVKIDNTDKKSVVDIARELRELAERLRKGKDENFKKSNNMLRNLPTWLIRPLLWFTGLLTSGLGIDAKGLGLEAFPFGSCIVTSVGMLGIDEGFAPPTPFARVPLLVLIGAIRDQPIAVDGEVVIRPMMTLSATIDHRFVDGFQAAELAKTMRAAFENPWMLDELDTK